MKKSLISIMNAAIQNIGGQAPSVDEIEKLHPGFGTGVNRLSQKGRRKRARWTGNGK